ncbi:hypothetical protein B0T18DRAFT_244349 [Schizothecium vesticola]|uniref:Uncharacterized protein n=1 Tax=Schizothecium vesticola TaxID=314040 RepID=A0AA40BQ45_9PEZI|nr:hypothetical protein B0T18DRAFT_244349 [Schizothecium vesticola]
MRFMGGGDEVQLPLEPFVANKHLILNHTTTPAPQIKHTRASQLGRRAITKKAVGQISGETQQRCLLHAALQQSYSTDPRLIAVPDSQPISYIRKTRHFIPMQEQDSWPRDLRLRLSEVEGNMSLSYGDMSTGGGRRDHRRRISSTLLCRFGSPLDVGIDRPASGVGEPLWPLSVSVPQACRPRVPPISSCGLSGRVLVVERHTMEL